MSKWNKSQGVVVPLDSLLKERRKENCPAPRRSAGLVGRWGITSFTSIRSRSYVAEYNNVDLKDATGLELGTGDSPDSVVNLLGSNNTESVRPRKFFKSRNIIPPPPPPLLPPTVPNEHLGHSPYGANSGGYGAPAGTSDLWNQPNITTTTPPQQQQFYQPLSAAAATPQFSPTGPQSANVGLFPGGHVGDGMAYAMQQQQLLHTIPLTKEKKPGRKKKSAAGTIATLEHCDAPLASARKTPGNKPPKKEKKEKRAKKAKKEQVAGESEQGQPKRNSSRIRNRVVNYNEDEDSNDYERSVVSRTTNNHHHNPPFSTPEYGILAPPTDPSFAGALDQHSVVPTTAAPYHPMVQRPVSSSSSPAGGYHSGGEGRYSAKPSTTTTVTTPLPSPSEHRPILLRISKGTSMLISTDSEEVSTNNSTPPTTTSNVHYNQQQQSDQLAEDDEDDFDGNLPPRTLLAERGPTTTVENSVEFPKAPQQLYNHPPETFLHSVPPAGEGTTLADVQQAVPVPKTELKIKISLGGKPLISSTTSGAGSTTPNSNVGTPGKATKSSSKYNFKKRAIEREKARSSHLSSKRSKVDVSDGEQNQQGNATVTTQSVTSSTVVGKEKVAVATLTRPSFPLPGTDTYEVFRTLSSLSGGDDFDSQSSILGSASSDNNTPKHTLAPGEDCQIIHSRGSSDCGSDLELSQNSSTAAAPPSDVYSESENTQDNNQQQQVAASHQPARTAAVASSLSVASCPTASSSTPYAAETLPPVDLLQQQPSNAERVEVLKLNLKNVGHGTRVTRNKMKHSNNLPEEQQQEPPSSPAKQLLLRTGRTGRNRAAATVSNNNNNNVVRGTVNEKRTRKQPEPVTMREDTEEQIMTEPSDPIQSQQQHQQPAAVEGVLHPETVGLTTETPSAVNTTALESAVGHKPSVTRQYSRRKKNVVPPDYLGEASTVPDTVAPFGEKTDSSSAVDQQELPSHSLRQNGDLMTEPRMVTSCSSAITPPVAQEVSSAAGAVVPPQPPPTTGPPPPMRLVLQKKGTIFKSRPMVGSTDGATDTKKRHVYKHKWDNDHGNGMMDEQAALSGVGVVGANADTASGLVGSSAVGAGGNATGLGGGGVGSGKATGDSTSLTDRGCGDGMEGDEHDGGNGGLTGAASGGGISGGNQLDYDGNFFDNDTPTAMPPRSKRLKTFAPSGNSAGTGGSTGQGTAGAGVGVSGAVGSAHYHHHSRAQTSAADEYDGAAANAFDDDANGGDDEYGAGRSRQAKPFYTIVRNVKNSHQMQEIGEFQEMDDDVDYILSALHPDNPISTRCLSALQLATKCMKPAFKMHVRAHGVVTRFFRALSDAHQDPSLGLCTAAIMYVFSQDKLNMDLDRDSLELMLNLLDTDHKLDGTIQQQQQQQGQLQKNRQRVKELCEEIKGAGKGKHIDTDRVTAGSLAMESLLSLTSQRAGEWFKDELRNLGGIEHLIKTVAECYEQVPSRASDWTEQDVAKLRKIERCLRVLNNVSLFNCQNQRFLLEHRSGLLVQILVRLYRQVDRDLMHYPTDDATPKESIGVLLRELLQPMLHMLITLTHAFNEEAQGAHLVGKQPDVINITMHLLLRISEYVPQRFVFDLHLLALTLLLHLARPSPQNRQQVLCYMDSETNRGGIKALVEYFEQQEEMASHAEAKTNAILETPARTVDAEDAETKLIQKAEHHMEHTYMGSHVCMLICQLVMGEQGYEQIARMHLKNNNFKRMVAALSRYYEFLNLTTNADAESTAHKRQTKEAIDYLSQLDGCETSGIVRTGTTGTDATAAIFCE
ncbi:protein wings apart-like [Anopheles marshallii]|uniref:protein wings apart-like n=1 Tax=Anopheles marshallii TaxID=1521116 RepID=UPI00237A11B4|nr:protein wings apart-like [Anopheles marshallii]